DSPPRPAGPDFLRSSPSPPERDAARPYGKRATAALADSCLMDPEQRRRAGAVRRASGGKGTESMSLATRLKKSSVLAGVAMGLMPLAPSAAAEAPQVPGGPAALRNITTQGRGEVRARPDSFRLSVGVEARADTVEKAQREVNAKMARIIQDLNRLN